MTVPTGITWDGTRASVADGIAAWVGSEAMAALLAEFTPDRLPDAPLGERLAALESLSARHWDWRNGLERHQAVGEQFPADRDLRIRAATTALGLADRQTPAYQTYDHVLVLGGGVRTMVARADLAAAVIGQGVRTTTVAGLGSVRPLENQATECPTEGDAVDAGLRRAFALGQPTGTRSGTTGIGQPWWIRSYEQSRPVVHVLAAPSTRVGMRANTGDTLIGWADLVEPAPEGARLLLVTTDIFVPFQHCDAIRLLSLPHNCLVDTIGFDTAASPWVKTPATFEILQEVRSAVRSMQALHLALER